MEYGYITRASSFNSTYTPQSYTTTTTAEDEFRRRSDEGVEKFNADVMGKVGTALTTTDRFEVVDIVYATEMHIYSVEVKNLHADSSAPRYKNSQLYEEIKRRGQFSLLQNKEMIPLLIRYFDDDAILFNLSTIDFENYVTVNNEDNATNNHSISKKIDELTEGGTLVRCENWVCTASTVRDRNKKTTKDVWFIPNIYGRWKGR